MSNKARYVVMEMRPEKDKRFKFLVYDRKNNEYERVKFGSKNGSTFIDHIDPKKKKNYIARHSKLNEDWTDPMTAGFWARWYLWSEPTIKEAEKLISKKFDIEFL